MHLVLMIDEFDMLFDRDARVLIDINKLAKYFRAMVQQNRLGIITAGDTSLDELPRAIQDYDLFNITMPKRVSFLDREAAIALIQQPTRLLKYEPQAIEYLLRLSGGHPCLLQSLCHNIVNCCNKNTKLNVDLETVDEVVPLVYEQIYLFHYLIEQLAETEKRVIVKAATLVSGDRSTFAFNQLGKVLGKGKYGLQLSQLENLLNNLRRHEILAVDNQGNYRFTMEIFRRWLVESRPMSYRED